MLKWFAIGLSAGILFISVEVQATCTLTYPLSSGTTAVGSQVIQDLNDVANCSVSASGGTLTGGTLSGTTTLPGSGVITSTGSVGIGTTAPDNALTIQSGTISYKNSSAATKGYVGTAAVFGSASTDDLQLRSDASHIILGFSGTETMRLTSGGAVQFSGITTTASAANAFLDSANSNNLLRSTSSLRYKRDLRPVSYEEARKVLDLTPVSFHSKSLADDPSRVFEGLIAEEVAQHLPQFVNYLKDVDGKEIPDGVQYDRIAAVALLSVVKEQEKKIAALQACRLWCMVKEAMGFPTVK